jgi:hypothetical protein
MTWKGTAIVLMVLIGLELVWIYAHWSLITTAWQNRETISTAGDIGGGVAAVAGLLKKL